MTKCMGIWSLFSVTKHWKGKFLSDRGSWNYILSKWGTWSHAEQFNWQLVGPLMVPFHPKVFTQAVQIHIIKRHPESSSLSFLRQNTDPQSKLPFISSDKSSTATSSSLMLLMATKFFERQFALYPDIWTSLKHFPSTTELSVSVGRFWCCWKDCCRSRAGHCYPAALLSSRRWKHVTVRQNVKFLFFKLLKTWHVEGFEFIQRPSIKCYFAYLL